MNRTKTWGILVALALASGQWGCPHNTRPDQHPAGEGDEAADNQLFRSYSETEPYAAVALLGDRVYAGTSRGLLSFDRRSREYTLLTPRQGLPGKQVHGLASDARSTLWVATESRVGRLVGDKWKSFPYPAKLGLPVTTMVTVGEQLWVGGKRGLAALSRDGKWRTFLPGAGVTYLLEDLMSGGVWVGTNGEGIFRYQAGSFVPHSPAQGQSIRVVRCMTFTAEGGLMAVGRAAKGERLTFYDGKYWTSYSTRPGARLSWVMQVGMRTLLGHGNSMLRLTRLQVLRDRPGAGVGPRPTGPVILEGRPSPDAPTGYPVPLYNTRAEDTWLPTVPTAVVGYSRQMLVGTRNLGMALADDSGLTWYRTRDKLGPNDRLRMACTAAACYLPSGDGGVLKYSGGKLVLAESPWGAGARVQGFFNDAAGGVLSLHTPPTGRSLVVSRLSGERFVPLYESPVAVLRAPLEVRFIRLDLQQRLWVGLWYQDANGDRQPWGVVLLKAPPPAPPGSGKAAAPAVPAAKQPAPAPQPAAKQPAVKPAPTDEPGAPVVKAPAATPAPQPVAKQPAPTDEPGAPSIRPPAPAPAAAAEPESPEDAPPRPRPAAPVDEEPPPYRPMPGVPSVPALVFHRSTLSPNEGRPGGSLALPDDIRDVWFDKDSFWVATSQGVCLVKGDLVEQFTENEGLASEITYGVGRSLSGEVLVASYGGLGRFTNGKWYFDQDEPLDGSTRAILLQGQTMWVATARGVVRKSPQAVKVYNEAMGLAGDMVSDIYVEGGRRIWVLTDLGLSIGKLPLQ